MNTRKLLTPEEIKEAFERYEDIMRPLILFGAPEDIKLVKEYCPEYSQYFTFKETDQLEPGKLICCKKEDLKIESYIQSDPRYNYPEIIKNMQQE